MYDIDCIGRSSTFLDGCRTGKYGSGGLFCIALIAIQDFPSSSASSHHRPDKGKGGKRQTQKASASTSWALGMTTNTKTAKSCAASFRRPQYTHTHTLGRQRSTCELLKDWHALIEQVIAQVCFLVWLGRPPARQPA